MPEQREKESSPSPPRAGYLCPGPAAAARGAVHAAGQLRSPPALPAPPWPLGLAPPWSASSFPPPPGWAPREARQLLLAKLSSCCAGVGLSKTTERFALDSLAFFFFFFKLSLSVTPSLLPSWGPSSTIPAEKLIHTKELMAQWAIFPSYICWRTTY